MSEETTPQQRSVFSLARDATKAVLESQLRKAQASGVVIEQKTDTEDFLFGKAVTEDPTYAIHSAGWKDKPHRIQTGHLKQMSKKDSVIAAIIQTRQNQVSGFSRYVTSVKDKGWMLELKDQEKRLEEIKEKLRTGKTKEANKDDQTDTESKSNEDLDQADTNQDKDDVNEWEYNRQAKAMLREENRDAKEKLAKFLKECGTLDEDNQKPFAASRWSLDDALRAWVRDSLTYDLYASEMVFNQVNELSYFFPVDGATVKFSSNRFKDYKAQAESYNNLNLLYPDRQAKSIEESKILELDPEKLDSDAYKWVQVVNGRIERAYTDDELKVGMRNPVTDIYNNGYSISELEILVALVTSHLNAEYYNQAYFTQGFSAKGILHIKSSINRRKLEAVRQEWKHMLSGAKNSFRTPIFAGVDDVNWIPLTQNHDDIGFEGWMRYLIKMICAIYQIDPAEIGVAFKEEGGSGGGLGGDSTREKLSHSKDKGLHPLLRHLENYINQNIIDYVDERFEFKFTGIASETEDEALERQKKESEFKKTLNEIREEDGLAPIPGADDLILSPVFIQWLQMKQQSEMMDQQSDEDADGGEDDGFDDEAQDSNLYDDYDPDATDEDDGGDFGEEAQQSDLYKSKSIKKANRPQKVKIEYFTLNG